MYMYLLGLVYYVLHIFDVQATLGALVALRNIINLGVLLYTMMVDK